MRLLRAIAATMLVAAGLVSAASGAQAAIISGTYAFSFGSFTITFDNSASIAETTSGITLDSFVVNGTPLTLASPIGFTYTASVDSLTVGGTANGVGAIGTTPDFVLVVASASANPTRGIARVAPSATETIGAPTEITFTPIPEPSALALLGLGLVGVGAARRRRASPAT